MSTHIGLAAIVFAFLSAPAHATTLVNDPAHPFKPKRLASLQRCVDRSQVPTIPGAIVASADVTEVIAGGLAGDRYIALSDTSCFSVLHELAHESQMFVGPGSVAWANQNYGHGAVGWSDLKINVLAALLKVKSNGRLAELSADAYATCAIHGKKWERWWGHYLRSRKGVTWWKATPTPYGFQAGPKLYQAICAALG